MVLILFFFTPFMKKADWSQARVWGSIFTCKKPQRKNFSQAIKTQLYCTQVNFKLIWNQPCVWKFASVCTTISLFPFLFMNKFNWREKENKSQRPSRWKMKLPLMFEPNINSQYEIYVRFIRDSLLKTVFYALTFISQIKNSNIIVMCWLIDRFVDMFSGCGSIILAVYKLIRGHNDEFSCQ